MYNEFNGIFGFDELKKHDGWTQDSQVQFHSFKECVNEGVLPATALDDADWQFSKPSADTKKNATAIMRKAFTDDILGDSYSQLVKGAPAAEESLADNPIDAAMDTYFAKGVAGRELKRKVQKSGLGISEAMTALLTKFEEFFTIHEQRIMTGKINCLDVPGFLEMLNSKLEVG